MQADTIVFDVLLYSTVVSAFSVAVIFLYFYRRERHPAYLVWSLAFLVAALRYVLPATPIGGDLLSPVLHYMAGLRGILMIWGAALFFRVPVRPVWALVLLAPLIWLLVGRELGWSFLGMSLLPSLFGSAGYLALGLCFLLNQPSYRWNGHRLFALAACLEAVHILDYPFLRDTGWAPLGFAIAQLLHYLMAVALLIIWVRREEYRVFTAHQTQERALRRVLRSRQRVMRMRQWTETLMEQISDGVVTCDPIGIITGFNKGAERIFGYRADQMLGRPLDTLISPNDNDGTEIMALAGRVDDAIPNAREAVARARDGRTFAVEVSVSELSLAEDEAYVAIVRDISERKRQEERLNYLADHDGLTGLENRRAFEDKLGGMLEQTGEGWLVFLDLDDFKLINDSLGHRAGDATLMAMARRLKAKAGDQAMVGRHSGDEFVIFRPHDPELDLHEWIESLVAAVRQPVALNEIEVMLSGSLGVAHYPDQGADVADLVRNADLAMYEAKRAGKNKYAFYRPALLEELNRTADIATRLKKLDLDKELFLVFQPRMRLEERQLMGAEVLLRWRTPEGELIPPDRFIPVAEETGQILRIGYWVMEQACRFLSGWSHSGEPLVLSINLSARQLFDENLVEHIETIRQGYGLSPAQLEFEITESSAMRDMDHALRMLGRLRALGYGLSLDDFGTGFSSLSHLRQLPVDTVKIDRSFVEDITRDRHDRVLVASIIELASHLDKKVLAEGVESAAQAELLDSLGCDEIQGYWVARPLEAEVFVSQILEGWERLRAAL